MNREWMRRQCLALPQVTEHVQWGNDLVFKIAGGKMFALAVLEIEEGRVCASFKTSAEAFVELIERPGVIPAPYLARAQWVALQSFDALLPSELQRMLTQAHALVWAKLPKKTRDALAAKNA